MFIGVIVKFEDVSFSYNGMQVLKNVNLELLQKDFLGMIGPNGGGKTTILKLMLGLLKPDKGKITVFDKTPKESRHMIGYVPQFFVYEIDFPISVKDIVLMGRLGKKGLGEKYSKYDISVCIKALKTVGMDKFKDRQINELSGGQRQRVFIARAIASEPMLLLLDEPATSIDPEWQNAFFKLLNRLNKKIAIIMVTHDVTVISTYIDTIACVNQNVHFHGSTKEGLKKLPAMYQCPVDLIAHGIPHIHLKGDKYD